MRHNSSFSRLSSEPLHDHSGLDDLYTGRTRFEAPISHYSRPQSQPSHCSRVSPQKPSQEDRLLASRSILNEGELLRHTPDIGTDTFDKENEQQQHIVEANMTNDGDEHNVEEEQDGNIDDEHQEVNNVAAAQMVKRSGNTHLSSKEDEKALLAELQRPSPSYNSFPQPDQEGTGSYSDCCSGEINNTRAKSDKEQ
jgi:hypothetical protein